MAGSMTERMEHLHKSITRDLLAGERNHAVVPVRQFGERFLAFFAHALFTPLPRPSLATYAAGLPDAIASVANATRPTATRWQRRLTQALTQPSQLEVTIESWVRKYIIR